jgi:hypothetical protein
VRGGGLAGLAVAKLFLDRGAIVCVDVAKARASRVVGISLATLSLVAELFDIDPADLRIGPMVAARRVCWSDDSPSVVEQVSLICDAARLSDLLLQRLKRLSPLADDDDFDWIVEASGRPADIGVFGGDRAGRFARVVDAPPENQMTITATSDGWVYTAPHPEDGLAVLLIAPTSAQAAAIPADVAAWLGRAGRQVRADCVVDIGPVVPIAPRLARPMHTANTLLVGEAAMALDPLRGDGTGYALRGALLAQAAIAAAVRDGRRERYLAHYENRLQSAFISHLQKCSAHYEAARHSKIWSADIAKMDCLANRLQREDLPLEFRLVGLNLVPLR